MANYTHVAKVVLVGNSGVGKTCLAQRFAGEDFTDSHLATIGADFKTNIKKVDEDCTLKTIFWDTCGQERYRSIAHNFFRGSHAVAVVYDSTDADSFVDVGKWIADLEESTAGGRDLVRLLLGNKAESSRKIVDADTAARFAGERGFFFMEVSAKSGLNLDAAYSLLAERIVESSRDATRIPDVGEDDAVRPGRDRGGGKSAFECCSLS